MLLLFAGLAQNVKLGGVVQCRRAHAFLLSFCDCVLGLWMVVEDCGWVLSLVKEKGACGAGKRQSQYMNRSRLEKAKNWRW